VARALVRSLAAEADALGCVSLHLQVEASNATAVEVYARVGFTTHHAYAYLSPGVAPSPVS
jgi:predicted GNAT family acetyltransferase